MLTRNGAMLVENFKLFKIILIFYLNLYFLKQFVVKHHLQSKKVQCNFKREKSYIQSPPANLRTRLVTHSIILKSSEIFFEKSLILYIYCMYLFIATKLFFIHFNKFKVNVFKIKRGDGFLIKLIFLHFSFVPSISNLLNCKAFLFIIQLSQLPLHTFKTNKVQC